MDNLERLIRKIVEKELRIQIRFDPEEDGEEWSIKVYPDLDDDAHFYAYNTDLGSAARQIFDEMRGFQIG